MTPLITKEDIDGVSPISETINSDKRVEPYILEAQRYELHDLLTKDLFYDFFANLTSPKYTELLNGKTYENDQGITIEYRGMKDFISYYSLARILHKQAYHITKSGITKKKTDESEPLTNTEIQSLINSARNNGASEAAHVRMFLDDHTDIYEHWRCGPSPNNFGVNVSAVGGTGDTDAYKRNDYLYD